MINAVSNVSFRGTEPASDWQQLIESEGQYTQKPTQAAKPDSVELSNKPEKKGKAGKVIGGTIAAVVVAGLALFGLSRGNILKIDKDAKGMAKIGSWLAEAGEWIGTKMIDPIRNLFKSSKAKETVKEAAETAAEAVAEGTKKVADTTAEAVTAAT